MSESRIGGLKSAFEPAAAAPKPSAVSGLTSRFEASSSPEEPSAVAGKIGELAGAFGGAHDDKKGSGGWAGRKEERKVEKTEKAEKVEKEAPVRVREAMGEKGMASAAGVGGVAALFEKGVRNDAVEVKKGSEREPESSGVGGVTAIFESKVEKEKEEGPSAFAEAAKRFGS